MRAMSRHRYRPAIAVALIVVTIAAACAVNPVSGRRELSFMSPEREAALGSQAAREVAAEIGVIEQGPVAEYVRAIGGRIAAASPRTDVTYRFHVADMAEPNAFALPGGYIYVSRGLLAITNSEEELAAVIGHEVGHVAARHAAQRETRATGLGVLSLLGTVAAGVFGGSYAAQAANQLGQVAGAGLIAAYSRDQERQADQVGQEMTARAGWNPAAMSSFLRTLDRYTRLDPRAGRRPSFFDSHPMTPERVDTTAAFAETVGQRGPGTPIAATRAEFLRKIEGIVVGPDPAAGVVDGMRFLHPDLDFHLLLPQGWQVENSRAALGVFAPRGDALLTLMLQEQGNDPAAAARTFLQANRLQPVAAGPLAVGGFDAYRAVAPAVTQGARVGLHLTWIAQRERIFRITGVAAAQLFNEYAPAFEQTAGSFGALTADERRSVHVRLLHAVPARDGETLSALAARAGDTWSTGETAAANALTDGVRLASGQLVKVVVARPYATRP